MVSSSIDSSGFESNKLLDDTSNVNPEHSIKGPSKLYIKFSEVSNTKVFYSSVLLVGICISYAILGYYLVPMWQAGTLALHLFILINAGLAVLWLGIINIVNKYWIQNIITSKGKSDVDG